MPAVLAASPSCTRQGTPLLTQLGTAIPAGQVPHLSPSEKMTKDMFEMASQIVRSKTKNFESKKFWALLRDVKRIAAQEGARPKDRGAARPRALEGDQPPMDALRCNARASAPRPARRSRAQAGDVGPRTRAPRGAIAGRASAASCARRGKVRPRPTCRRCGAALP